MVQNRSKLEKDLIHRAFILHRNGSKCAQGGR